MPRPVDPRFGARMRELLDRQGMSFRALAAHTFYGKSYLHELATGRKTPTLDTAARIDAALGAGGELAACVSPELPAGLTDDELEALELGRRAGASDVSAETLARLESVVDELAMAYSTVPPELLLPRVRRHLGYLTQLVDARATLDQRRRLLTAGGWLSLLAATVHLDLRQRTEANARLATAAQLGGHAEHAEIQAWCLETRAWDLLNTKTGDYPQAVEMSQRAQAIAPRGSSAHIQATAQEGRAWARMGCAAETRDVLDRVARLVSSLPVPEHPEHHYRYDPNKALSYTATTLAWVGDPAAEDHARIAIAELESPDDGVPRPRRIALARLDLGLALLATNRPDEASSHAQAAIESGRIVPSNWWRAREVVDGVAVSGIREAGDLREVFETYRPEPRQP